MPSQKMSIMALEHLHRYYWAAPLAKDKAVLDMACGEGYGTAILSKQSKQICGCDVSVEAVMHAKAHYKEIDFRVMSLEKIDFAPASFDLITCFETIEHVAEAVQVSAISSFATILKPSGLLLISTPNTESALHVPNKFHQKEFAPKEFEKILKESFAHVRIIGQSVYCASIITDGDKTRVSNYPQVSAIGQERYLLALCSQEPLPEEPSSVFIDRGNQSMQQLAQVKRCVSWVLPYYNFVIKCLERLMPTAKLKQKISKYRC